MKNGDIKTLTNAVMRGFDCTGRSDVEVGISVEASVKDFLRNRFAIAYMRAETYAPDIAAAILAELERLSKDLQIRPADAWIQEIRSSLKDGSGGVGV